MENTLCQYLRAALGTVGALKSAATQEHESLGCPTSGHENCELLETVIESANAHIAAITGLLLALGCETA